MVVSFTGPFSKILQNRTILTCLWSFPVNFAKFLRTPLVAAFFKYDVLCFSLKMKPLKV